MMKGYYKVELRPCECGGTTQISSDGGCKHFTVFCTSCDKRSINYEWGEESKIRAVDDWNTRPAFDKAIDALIGLILLCEVDAKYSFISHWHKVTRLTRLQMPEALEIYKQRQEGKHD